MIMRQPAKSIKIGNQGSLFFALLKRKSDSKQFNYNFKSEEPKPIIWANLYGRWRDNELDETITFFELGKELHIFQSFSDGSKDEQVFKKDKLK